MKLKDMDLEAVDFFALAFLLVMFGALATIAILALVVA